MESSDTSSTSPQEGKGAIFAAFAANVGIAISKFIAFLLTGATSMLAEGVHSLADSSNQVLLLIGSKQSRRAPTRVHPFGYGRAHFVYAFMISIVLFLLGGAFAIYEGLQKLSHPTMIEAPVVAYIVLCIAVVFEGLALRTALREAKQFKPQKQNWWQFLRATKSVNHVVLALEDSAALLGLSFAGIGITLTLLTENPLWDTVATMMIGLLLVCVAVFLFREVKSLLIGESVDPAMEKKIRDTVLSVEAIDQVVDLKTLYTGPNELFVAMKVIVGSHDSAKGVAWAIDEVEARLRRDFPIARLIYIEPDVYKSEKEQRQSDQAIERVIATKKGK